MWTNCAYCGKTLVAQEGSVEFTGYCDPNCETYYKEGKNINTAMEFVDDDSIWNGTWEHITHKPIEIKGGRKELIAVCKKYNVCAKGILKPKSQSKGWEMKSKRF